MLCFSVDSRDSLENIESKWVGEIAENCAGVKLVLVALKCDLREGAAAAAVEDEAGEEEEDGAAAVGAGGKRKEMIDYKQGLEVAKRIQALRYLGMFWGFFCLPSLGWDGVPFLPRMNACVCAMLTSCACVDL